MKESSLQDFKEEIKNIREYVKHIELVNKIEATNRITIAKPIIDFNEHLKSFGINKKIFEYKAIIVSLYGILESYVSIWIQEYIDSLFLLIPNYNSLKDSFVKNHFNLSIKLISIISENRYAKYDSLRKENILLNLSTCLSSPLNYKLNSEAFIPLSGNLKHSKIVEAFKPLDINLDEKLRLNLSFSTFLTSKYGVNISISERLTKFVKIIDDLVTRRNEIAHGAKIDNIINTSEFDDFFDNLEKYGEAIFETLIEKAIECETANHYYKIENIINIYKNGSVLCFEIENHKIKIGDYIIVQTFENYFIKKVILEIQLNKNNYRELDIKNKVKIGVNLGSGISINQSFYIKKI
jgi:hypothetical protein